MILRYLPHFFRFAQRICRERRNYYLANGGSYDPNLRLSHDLGDITDVCGFQHTKKYERDPSKKIACLWFFYVAQWRGGWNQ